MTDSAPAVTVVPAPQGGGSPSSDFKVPEGKVLIDAAEQQKWQRQREQLAGLTQFHGEATKRGFSKADDFAGYDKFKTAMDRKGLKMDALAQALMAEEQDHGQSAGGLDIAAIEKHFADKFIPADRLQAELDKRDALHAHRAAMSQEGAAVEKAIAALLGKLGDGASARDKTLLPSAFKALVNEKRSVYPTNHLLHESELAPFNDEGLAKLAAEFEKSLGLAEAEAIAELGDAANRKGATPPAGASGTKPPKQDAKDKPRVGTPEHTRLVEERARQLQARRAGGPMSSAAG